MQDDNTKTNDSSSFERVREFKYLRTTVNQNCIKEKLQADGNQVMPGIICCRVFYLPVCYPKI
jgi:hypothetical protein